MKQYHICLRLPFVNERFGTGTVVDTSDDCMPFANLMGFASQVCTELERRDKDGKKYQVQVKNLDIFLHSGYPPYTQGIATVRAGDAIPKLFEALKECGFIEWYEITVQTEEDILPPTPPPSNL